MHTAIYPRVQTVCWISVEPVQHHVCVCFSMSTQFLCTLTAVLDPGIAHAVLRSSMHCSFVLCKLSACNDSICLTQT